MDCRKVEMFSPDKYMAIINHKGLCHSLKGVLKKYFKSKYNGNHVEIHYKFGKGCEDDRLGRLYCGEGVGLQSMERNVRNLLAQDYYWDIDMRNAQPNILLTQCTIHGWNSDVLEYYVNHRDEVLSIIMDYYGCTTAAAKNVIIRLMYLGDDSEWLNDTTCSKKPSEPLAFITKFKEEFNRIAENVYASQQNVREFINKKKKLSPHKKRASVMSYFLQTEENAILMQIDSFLQANGRSMDVFIFDGGLVRKQGSEIDFPHALLRSCEEFVSKMLGYNIELVVKPMDSDLVFENSKDRVLVDTHTVIDDSYAAKEFARLMKSHIIFCDEKLHVFDDMIGIWSNRTSVIKRYIIKYEEKLKFYQAQEDDATKYKLFNYAGCERNVANMLKFLPCFCEDETFFLRRGDSSKGKLLFADGIYNFDSHTFSHGFDKDIVFKDRISRAFPKNRNEELIKEVNTIIFRDPFIEQDYPQANHLKIGLARALYGDYRAKLIYFCIGTANAGKGVICDAISGAFEGFVDVFNGNELLYNENTSDEAKKLSFVYDLKDKRVAFSNEIKMTKCIDGNLIKKIASGGDGYKARVIYGNPEKIINRSTEFLMVNDIPTIAPNDEAVKNRVRCIEYKKTFVNKESYIGGDDPSIAFADPRLKDKFVNHPDYQDAMVHLMFDAYKEYLRDGHNVPSGVSEACKSWVGDSGSIKSHLEKEYEITNNSDDYVAARELIDYLVKTCKLPMSDTKIGIDLGKVVKLVRDVKRENGKSVKIWKGIKKISIGYDMLD